MSDGLWKTGNYLSENILDIGKMKLSTNLGQKDEKGPRSRRKLMCIVSNDLENVRQSGQQENKEIRNIFQV